MNVGFIGMGNMGQMLVTALARSQVLHTGELFASNRSQEKLRRFAAGVPGLKCVTNCDLANQSNIIFLCVKPGETKAVLEEIGPYITPEHLLVTITNTIEIPKLEAAVHARVAKVIPCLLHAVGSGVSLLMFGKRCTAQDRETLIDLMGRISYPQVILESQARVASDLTSCGPAFLSYVFRALAQAARQYEPCLPEEIVDTMIRQTALGTCRLMEETGLQCDDIIAKVSTPGGVTAEGIKVMDELMAGVWEQVIETTMLKEEHKKARVQL